MRPQRSGSPLQQMVRDLMDRNPRIVAKATDSFRMAGPETQLAVLTALRQSLCHGSPDVRGNAARGLGAVADRESVADLLNVLKCDPNSRVRSSAAFSLGKLQEPAAVPGLLAALRDFDWKVALAAAEVLAQSKDAAVLPGLLSALVSSDHIVRSYAAIALCQSRDSRGVPALLEVLRAETDSHVRFWVVLAVERMGDLSAVAALLEALKVEKDARVRRTICRALGKICAPAKAALETVAPALSEVAEADSSRSVQTTAILTLETLRPRGRGLSRGLARRSDLAVAPRERRRRTPKREAAEALKSLLALLIMCVNWPSNTVSERQLHRSPLLKEQRERLGLPENVSAGTIHNHLQTLARLCRVDRLFDPEPKNQFSTFRPGVKELLLRQSPYIEEEIVFAEEDPWLHSHLQQLAPSPESDAIA